MISEKAITAIRANKKCKGRLQMSLEKSPATIQRYLDSNDIMLTTSKAMEVIKEETGLSESQILVKSKSKKVA